MSLGGVRDEAEIRGHRRTYIGALPGRLVRALRDAEHDEPGDHARRGRQGRRRLARRPLVGPARGARPGAEPHASATTTWTWSWTCRRCCSSPPPTWRTRSPAPLLDRMEVVRFDGYTVEEKVAIARDYLWPRQRERNGLREDEVTVEDDVLRTVVTEYTREAGVRSLERELGTVLRKTATQIASGKVRGAGGRGPGRRSATPSGARSSSRRRPSARRCRAWPPAWPTRPVGGDVLFIEATSMRGGSDGGPGAHRPAGRRDEGVGADRALLRARARGPGRRGRGGLRGPRVPRARAGGGDPQGRPQRRRHDDHGAGVAALGPAR